ncbi:MAG: MoxR family ATPase, partial [Planctomycetales bacterium]
TPPKTQAALLEAMQEKMVSAGGEDFHLDLPFFVLATQNPLEQEGTYALPEAQLDRFMFKIHVDYPSQEEEVDIMRRVTGSAPPEMSTVLTREEILTLQELVRRVPVADHIFQYVSTLVRSTRPLADEAPEFIKNWVAWGCGPRACLNLIIGSKARAILNGRYNVAIEDVQALALPVMRHRMGLNFAAQSDGVNTDDVVSQLLESIPTDGALYHGAAAAGV